MLKLNLCYLKTQLQEGSWSKLLASFLVHINLGIVQAFKPQFHSCINAAVETRSVPTQPPFVLNSSVKQINSTDWHVSMTTKEKKGGASETWHKVTQLFEVFHIVPKDQSSFSLDT